MVDLYTINGQSSGKIEKIFSITELKDIENKLLLYKNKVKSDYTKKNTFTGIDSKNPLYSWFIKKIFNKIKDFTDYDLKLLFGAILESKKPIAIHSDWYNKKDGGDLFMNFLIPLSLDLNKEVNDTFTIIFNEIIVEQENENQKGNEPIWNNYKKLENNATNYIQTLLSHIEHEKLEKLSIQNILQWTIGDVLFWDSRLMHCSNDFISNGNFVKHGIVIQTYVDK